MTSTEKKTRLSAFAGYLSDKDCGRIFRKLYLVWLDDSRRPLFDSNPYDDADTARHDTTLCFSQIYGNPLRGFF